MGDRGNIVVLQGDPGRQHALVFYTHWSGSCIGNVVQEALAKRWRWSDEAYLARIIFCQLVKGQEMTETGFGICVGSVPDNEHPILVVDCARQEVRVVSDIVHAKARKRASRSIPFEGFVALSDPDAWADPDVAEDAA
jgi:hypothetical protein